MQVQSCCFANLKASKPIAFLPFSLPLLSLIKTPY